MIHYFRYLLTLGRQPCSIDQSINQSINQASKAKRSKPRQARQSKASTAKQRNATQTKGKQNNSFFAFWLPLPPLPVCSANQPPN
jgi:hypothetical protein